jgi:hypothetical protein
MRPSCGFDGIGSENRDTGYEDYGNSAISASNSVTSSARNG